MADSDVTITAGAGTKIDTRTVGPSVDEHRQVIVVGDPTTNTAVAPVTAASGLRVEPYMTNTGGTGIAGFQQEDQPHVDGHAGVMMLGVRNHFSGSTTDGDYAAVSVSSYGDLHTVVRKDTQKISVTSSGLTTTTTNYSTGDKVGNHFTISGAARIAAGSGLITAVVLSDASNVIGAMDVVFMDTSLTTSADNAAWSITTATDVSKVLGVVQLAGPTTHGTARTLQAVNLALPFTCAAGSTTIYAALVTRTGTFLFGGAAGASSLQLTVYIDRY